MRIKVESIDKIHYYKAQFQVDPLIAIRNVNGVSDLIWSNDSDFIAHNPQCILIKGHKVGRDGIPYAIILGTGDVRITDKVTKILNAKFSKDFDRDDSSLFTRPKFPIFEKESNYMCRALIACALGNDYWKDGQAGVGPSTVSKWLPEDVIIEHI